MNANSPFPPTSPKSSHRASEVGRRSVLAGIALAVPAVAVTVSTPAFAASSGANITLSSSGMRVLADGATSVTTTVRTTAGQAAPGRAVSFTGPAGATFTPSSATTSSSGVATTSVDLNDAWARPGSSKTLSAVASPDSGSQTFSVVGANAYGVGNNSDGQLGNGTTSNVTAPAQLSLVFPSPVVETAGGYNFSLALLQDGTVWAAGSNSSRALGDGTYNNRSSWGIVPGLAGVVHIAAGYDAGYALLSNGTVRSWGENWAGQLGVGDTNGRSTPTAVPNISTATAIAAGAYHAHVLLSDGSLRGWGWNQWGQVGDGTSGTDRVAPTTVVGLSGVTAIAGGGRTAYAVARGAAYSWGTNDNGQLGTGSPTPSARSTPGSVFGLASNVTQIAGQEASAVALLSSGEVRAWGMNNDGQLGNGRTTDSAIPVIAISGSVKQISAGYHSGYALMTSGSVVAWGLGTSGQLGQGTSSSSTPVTVGGLSSVTALGGTGSWSTSMFYLR